MKKTIILIVAAALTAFSAPAQDWAKARLDKSPRHGEWVPVKQGTREVASYITYPGVSEKATAVVVIHEIFGLTDWVRGVTDQFAEAGYIAIAPDLLSGKGPNGGGSAALGGPDAVRGVIGSLPADQKTADLNAVIEYVSKLPSCNGKVVVIGFCWGGTETFRLATNNKLIKAAMPFYGSGPTDEAALGRIECPVYGFYPEKDMRVVATVNGNATNPGSVALMKKAGKTFEPVIYAGADHGFMRLGEDPGDKNDANKKAREESWTRIKAILKKI